MKLECAEKINEMLSLVDCNCVGKHQSAVQLMDVMLYNQWITPMEKQQIDALRTYQEYDTNVYGFHPRLILLELYKRIYYEDKYPVSTIMKLICILFTFFVGCVGDECILINRKRTFSNQLYRTICDTFKFIMLL